MHTHTHTHTDEQGRGQLYDETLPVGDRMLGKNVTVINRSEIVGRPLAAMLANDGADVYSVDLNGVCLMKRGKVSDVTESQEAICKKSKIIITGVPTKDYKLPTEWVQPGTVVINVSHFKNVDEEALLSVPGVKYVPLVGKVTGASRSRSLPSPCICAPVCSGCIPAQPVCW